MTEQGYDVGDIIILYNQEGRIGAERGYWILHTYGFTDVYVLDGGINVWKTSGGEVEPGVEQEKAIRISPEDVHFDKTKVIYLNEILDDLQGERTYLYVDVRPSGQYDGSQADGNLTRGHIMGAVNIPVV